MSKDNIASPNILVMMVDQMRADYMGCAGNPWMKTPNLDRLAAEGTRFTQAVTTVPVCIAARHSFLTGHRCATHGRFTNNVPNPEPLCYTIPQLLGSAGYRTRALGKMHFRTVRRHFGFHAMELMEEIPDSREEDDYLMYLKANDYGHKREVHGVRNLLYHLPQVSVIPEEHHGNTWVADRTIEFIRTNRAKPFFAWASWIAPHPPWNPPEPFASFYDPASLPLPHNFNRDVETLPPMHRGMTNAYDMGDAPTDRLQRVKALYSGSVSHIDKSIGRILHALAEHGIEDNTIVVFVSDHGEMMGDHGLWQKQLPFEGSVRVPLIVRFPGRVDAGVENDQLVSLLDLMPTFLDAAQVDAPGQRPLPGASLLGRTGGGLAQDREDLVLEIDRGEHRWLSIRSRDWKYNRWLADGWEELYDLKNDPHEDTSLLVGDVKASDRLRADKMLAQLTAWESQHGFPDSLDENGALVNFGVAPTNPSQHRVNGQFPTWVESLDAEEQSQMESRGETVVNAIRGEDTFRLEETDLKGFKAAGGSLEGTEYQQLLDAIEV